MQKTFPGSQKIKRFFLFNGPFDEEQDHQRAASSFVLLFMLFSRIKFWVSGHCRSLRNPYEVWTRVASKEMECWAGRILIIWKYNDGDDHLRGNEAVVRGHQLGSALLKTRSLNFAFFMFLLLICTRCFQAVQLVDKHFFGYFHLFYFSKD